MEDLSVEILLLEKGILELWKNYNDIMKLLVMMVSFEDGEFEFMLVVVVFC